MNLQENIHRIKEMMGINEELIGYITVNFALYAHLFTKLYNAYKKGNLEKEYSILMSDDNVNRKMVKYFYNFIINNAKFFEDKEVFTESNIPNHIKEETNRSRPSVISKDVDDVVYNVIDDMIRLNYGEIRTEKHSNNDGELDTTLLYDYNGDLIGEINRAYYDRNPEYNTLWIEKGYADKFVDSLTIYVPFDRTIREDYVKNYFQFEYAHMGKKILFINSRDGY